jgi:hypothetical protein
VRFATIASLARLPAGSVDDLLLSLAAGDPVAAIRSQAIHALGGSEHAGFPPLLIDVLEDRTGRTSEAEFFAAQYEATNLLDDTGWPELETALAAARVPRPAPQYAEDQKELVSQAPDKPLHAPAPEGLTTVRCWPAPGRAGGDYPPTYRVRSGMVVEVDDLFEVDGEAWVEADYACWLPLAALSATQEDGEAPTAEPDAPYLRHEFDLPWQELLSLPALALQERGLLEVFDPSAAAAAAVIRLDPEDRTAVRALLDAAVAADGELAAQLIVLADDLPAAYADDADLGALLEFVLADD